MKELVERFMCYTQCYPEVLSRALVGMTVILCLIVGVLFANLSYYKDATSTLLDKVTVYKAQITTLTAQVKVLETNFYGVVENYTIIEKGVAKDYTDKLALVVRTRGISKNVIFVNHLSKVTFDKKYVRLIAAAFYDAGLQYDIDPRELIATAWHESRFKPESRSDKGALGVMQVMPLWLENDSFIFANNVFTKKDLLDPVKSIQAGAYIYNHYKMYWKGRGYRNDYNVRRLALLSYNRGHRRVSNLLRSGENPANGYFRIIKLKYEKLKRLEKTMSVDI